MVARTIEDHAQSLSMYMPNGRLFEAKTVQDSNFRQLLRGLSGEIFTAQGYLTTLEQEYLPDKTTLFLSEWEQALSIPDDCFSGEGTNDERRRDIVVKLSSLGVQTASDFEALALIYGVAVEVTSGYDAITFPLTFPIPMYDTAADSRYTIIVRFTDQAPNKFPLVFPFIFGSSDIAIIECLFMKLAPENCNVVFKQS